MEKELTKIGGAFSVNDPQLPDLRIMTDGDDICVVDEDNNVYHLNAPAIVGLYKLFKQWENEG